MKKLTNYLTWLKTIAIFISIFIAFIYLALSIPPFNKIVYPEPTILIAIIISFIFSGLASYFVFKIKKKK